MKFPALPLFVMLLTAIACSSPAPPDEAGVASIPFPGTGETLAPRLSKGGSGDVLLSWLQREEQGATLWVSRYANRQWETPVKVVTDPEMFVNWADFPSVTSVGDSRWFAHWLSYSAPRKYAYDIRVSQSFDAGVEWTAPVTPHSDGTPTEHGFVSSWQEGEHIGLLWLDGRNMAGDENPGHSHSGMTLRTALVDAGGRVISKAVVDDLVCDCCQTDATVADTGPVAVYRDRTTTEIRDIFVARKVDGEWADGDSVADDGWNIAACPVNGPAIDAAAGLLATTWFTAAGEIPMLQVAFSDDAGATFKPALKLASGNVVGHVDIANLSNSMFVVSWVDLQDEQFAIRLQRVTPDGPVGDAVTVALSASRFQVPQLAVVDDALLIAWTDARDEVSGIRTALLPLDAM